MEISIFGLGYVGAVASACLAHQGHRVIGVDLNPAKVAAMNAGESPIVEDGLAPMIAEAVAADRFRATTEAREAVQHSTISLICVGTPSAANGSLDVSHVLHVAEEIAECLRDKADYHLVVLRSTVLPGTMVDRVRPLLERVSGKRAGVNFGLCNNPEFLRESTAVHDYFHPPKTVIGADDERSAETLMALYSDLPGPRVVTSLATAEMVKYADNNWHALKVCFANEIGRLCKSVGVDGHAVMDIFCRDEKLNISPAYLKPGFAFGGSCLPKDVRALTYKARSEDVDTPVLNAILPSNRLQLEAGIQAVIDAGHRDVAVLGFAFKSGTDDLRESPVVALIETLIGKGYRVTVYDPCVRLSALTGANREFLLRTVPHIADVMVDDMQAALDAARTVVIGNRSPEFQALGDTLTAHTVIDLVRIDALATVDDYRGLCW